MLLVFWDQLDLRDLQVLQVVKVLLVLLDPQVLWGLLDLQVVKVPPELQVL